MPIPDPPADLIQLRRDFLAAEARHADVCAQSPAGVEADETQKTAETAAFTLMRDLAVAISGHPWWDGVNRVEAEVVLRQAAKA